MTTNLFPVGVDLDGTNSFKVRFTDEGNIVSIHPPTSWKYWTIKSSTSNWLESIALADPDGSEVSIGRYWAELSDTKKVIKSIDSHVTYLKSKV